MTVRLTDQTTDTQLDIALVVVELLLRLKIILICCMKRCDHQCMTNEIPTKEPALWLLHLHVPVYHHGTHHTQLVVTGLVPVFSVMLHSLHVYPSKA